ncbi:MAG: hypothetical protein GXX09_01770 [Syntrophomonadaceae bacterium]|nr:hypothetical protein [Syntrophomonadaceae bacterium]
MRRTTTNWSVVGLGAAVAALGATLFRRSRFGAGAIGFGLAHMLLGTLDRVRAAARH